MLIPRTATVAQSTGYPGTSLLETAPTVGKHGKETSGASQRLRVGTPMKKFSAIFRKVEIAMWFPAGFKNQAVRGNQLVAFKEYKMFFSETLDSGLVSFLPKLKPVRLTVLKPSAMPPASRKSRRSAEPGAVRQSITAEAGWKQRIDVFRQKLQTQLKVIWTANSEQTRVDAVEDVRRSFYSVSDVMRGEISL